MPPNIPAGYLSASPPLLIPSSFAVTKISASIHAAISLGSPILFEPQLGQRVWRVAVLPYLMPSRMGVFLSPEINLFPKGDPRSRKMIPLCNALQS